MIKHDYRSFYLPSNLPIGIAVLTAAITSIYIFFLRFKKHRESTKPFQQLPTPPGWNWAGGHLSLLGNPDFKTTLTTLCITHANHHGQTGFWIANSPAISVTSVNDAKAILHSSNYRAPVEHIRRHMDQFLGNQNITLLTGKDWKFHRAAILKAFSPSAVQDAQRSVIQTTQVMVKSLLTKHDSIMDIEPLMKMITMDIFGRTALSTDFKCCEMLQPSVIAKAFDLLGNEFTKRLQTPFNLTNTFYWIPTTANRYHGQQRALIRTLIDDMVAERRTKRTENPTKDLLTCLLLAHEELSSETVSSQTLTDILMSLLFAGYDTTSITLTYALYHLGKYPSAEERCLEEILRVFSSSDNNPSPNDLVYCNAVILETLRLYPPANVTTRTMTKEVTLEGGFVAKSGTYALIPIWAIQHNPDYFPSPEEFIPERWVTKNVHGIWEERTEEDCPDNVIAPAKRSAFLAFSAGARSCAGIRFAMMEASLVLASLVKDISFSVDPKYVVEPVRAGFVQRPKGGMPMTLTFRSVGHES